MATLTGRAPKDTYGDLLQVSNANDGVDSTLRYLSDGKGTNSSFKISSADAQFTGTLTSTGLLTTTAGIVSGSNIISDTDSTDDLGSTGVRWANLWVDNITMGGTIAGAVATFSSTLTVTGLTTATGGITSGGDILSDTDSTDSLGSTTVRWLKGWFDTLTAGTLTIGGGTITDSSGAISFGNENLTTTGNVDANGVEFDSLSGTGAVAITDIKDEDNMASDSATMLATQQSIKAYVDAQVDTVDTLSEVLAIGNTSGATDLVMTSGQKVTTNTIDETTAASGVTIDSVLVKDSTVTAGTLTIGAGSVTDSSGAITFGNENLVTTGTLGSGATTVTTLSLNSVASNWTNAGRTIADLGIVTTADINGGTIDGTIIGGATAAALTATTIAGTTGAFSGNVAITKAGDITTSVFDTTTGVAASTRTLAEHYVQGKSDSGATVNFQNITYNSADATNGSEDGSQIHYQMLAGTSTAWLNVDGINATFAGDVTAAGTVTVGSGETNNFNAFYARGSSPATSSYIDINLACGDSNGGFPNRAAIIRAQNTSAGLDQTELVFLTADSAAPAEALRLDRSKNATFAGDIISATGDLLIGVASGSNHTIKKAVVGSQGDTILVVVAAGFQNAMEFFATAGSGASAAGTAIKISNSNTTGRSINASGTINASGADFAEYRELIPALYNNTSAGALLGYNSEGLLTNVFADVTGRFCIKSTSPAYVGNDIWGGADAVGEKPEAPVQDEGVTDECFADLMAQYELDKEAFEAVLEAARIKVDRIAIAGIVPVNVTGITVADVGTYLVPISNEDGTIGAVAIDEDNLTLKQYIKSFGAVERIDGDVVMAAVKTC